jgi:DNA helicase-2/ATP-dependent DNA helicase PcrA
MADVACHTVHAAAWKVVRRFCGYTPELLSSNFRTVADAARLVLGSRGRDTAVISEVLGEIEWGGARLLDPLSYEDGARKARREISVEYREVAEVWKVYEHSKKEMNVLDFADVLKEATRLLHDSSIGETVRSTWRAVVVDEFQDTDRAQHAFLNALRARRPLWTVVGDPRQTIYSFKGADTAILRDAMDEKDAVVIHLTTSWRCTEEILNEANTVIGAKYGAQLESSKHGDEVVFVSSYDDDEEVQKTIQQIQTWARRSQSYEEMAVLYRFNSMSPRFEAALTEAQIPYQVAGESKTPGRALCGAARAP